MAFALVGTVKAAVINYPPSNDSNTIASDDPTNSGVWSGLAQSFTAQDPNIVFGFYVGNYTLSPVSESLVFTLFSGDGVFSNPLSQQIVPVTGLDSYDYELVEANFSSVTLTPGNVYTVGVTLPATDRPTLGNVSDLSLLYNSLNNSYTGGRFYFMGSSVNESQFANRDLAFYAGPAPVPTSAPEPTSFALAGMTISGLIAVQRRRNRN